LDDRSDIQAAGSDIDLVNDLCYLGSYILYTGSCERDVKVYIRKAASVFSKMKKIWRNNNISLKIMTRLSLSILTAIFLVNLG